MWEKICRLEQFAIAANKKQNFLVYLCKGVREGFYSLHLLLQKCVQEMSIQVWAASHIQSKRILFKKNAKFLCKFLLLESNSFNKFIGYNRFQQREVDCQKGAQIWI